MSNFKKFLGETVEAHSTVPVTLILRRTAIRQFSGRDSVALYTNDLLGIKVAVPVDTLTGKLKSGNPIVGREVTEETLAEAPIHTINKIMRTGEEDQVSFRNGSSARVHPVTAKAVHDLWHRVNSTNKNKLSELINSSPEGLVKVAKFADSLANAGVKK